MISIQACALPEHALLAKYTRGGAYTDCWSAEVSRAVPQAEFVETFYTGAVFKLERLLLAWAVSRPSTDAQAKALALGALSSFSAWKVPVRDRATGRSSMGLAFKALLGFHKLYSRVLLRAACSRLARAKQVATL